MAIHTTAAAALADKTPGARTLNCTIEEAWTMAGKPAISVEGAPGFYAPPSRTGTGLVSVGVVLSAEESRLLIVRKSSADQLDLIMDRTEYAESGVALGDAAADQDLRRAAQAEIARRIAKDMGYDD